MRLNNFLGENDFYNKTEIEKVKILAFYNYMNDKEYEFDMNGMLEQFTVLRLPKPNKSRLEKNIRTSKDFIRGGKVDHYRLHPKAIINLKNTYRTIDFKTQEIETINTILPESLYKDSRGYIISLSKQINASYENNIFDGCAVLMRRLLEILLIHSYEKNNIQSEIKDSSGNYVNLSNIINNAKNNSKLAFSRDTKECLDGFRELGNFSAHKIYYTAKREDIDRVILNYRATCEELLYKSNLKK